MLDCYNIHHCHDDVGNAIKRILGKHGLSLDDVVQATVNNGGDVQKACRDILDICCFLANRNF